MNATQLTIVHKHIKQNIGENDPLLLFKFHLWY